MGSCPLPERFGRVGLLFRHDLAEKLPNSQQSADDLMIRDLRGLSLFAQFAALLVYGQGDMSILGLGKSQQLLQQQLSGG